MAAHIGFIVVACQTLATSGAMTATGVKVGDKIIGIWNVDSNDWASPGQPQNIVEAIVTVNDQIQQNNPHWSTGSNIHVLLLRE